MSSLYQLIFKKINNYIINIANADTDAAGEAVRWNGVNPYAHPKESENMQQWKQKNRAYIDKFFKNTSVEVSEAAWYGGSLGITYVGEGKMNANVAFINGGWALDVNAYKSFNVDSEGRLDGVYMETCASGGKGFSVGACAGSNGGNNPAYLYTKVGPGAGFKYGSSIGYSKTFDPFRVDKQNRKVKNYD